MIVNYRSHTKWLVCIQALLVCHIRACHIRPCHYSARMRTSTQTAHLSENLGESQHTIDTLPQVNKQLLELPTRLHQLVSGQGRKTLNCGVCVCVHVCVCVCVCSCVCVCVCVIPQTHLGSMSVSMLVCERLMLLQQSSILFSRSSPMPDSSWVTMSLAHTHKHTYTLKHVHTHITALRQLLILNYLYQLKPVFLWFVSTCEDSQLSH